MAALQTLRNKMGVLITALTGLALLAFVLTDLISSGNTIFSDRDKVGKVAGEKIKIQEFQNLVAVQEDLYQMYSRGASLTEEQRVQVRESVWQTLVNDLAFAEVYENAGIDVSNEEILDMVIGNHISYELRQYFTNPQTGVYDKVAAENFINHRNDDPQTALFWQNIEQNLRRGRLAEKYNSLVGYGLYCTTAEAKQDSALRSKTVDAQVVNIRYSLIPDSTINVSKSDIQKRYNKQKDLYKVDASRNIEYVSFPIKPSEEDIDAIVKNLGDMKKDFENPETDAFGYAHRNSDEATPETYRKLDQLSTELAGFIATASIGEVYGPYREGEFYKLSRLVEIVQRPDSVKARHILIRDNEQLADSLLGALKAGGDFAAAARQYSEDQGSKINGGDLDWFTEGKMVPEFENACFTNNAGAIVKVKTAYGYHIVNVQAKGVPATKYGIATISKGINYSSKTHQNVYDQAYQFLTASKTREQFEAAAEQFNLVKRYGNGIRANQQGINSLQSAREIVKWAFSAEEGEVSDIFEANDEFIVAVLTRIQEKGYAPLNEVSQSLSIEISNEAKAEQVKKDVANLPLAEIAARYNSKVDSVKSVIFSLNSVSGVGIEPALVGKIINTEIGQGGVVKGNNGIYAYLVTNSHANEANTNTLRRTYAQSFNFIYSLNRKLVIDNADVEDNRIIFY